MLGNREMPKLPRRMIRARTRADQHVGIGKIRQRLLEELQVLRKAFNEKIVLTHQVSFQVD